MTDERKLQLAGPPPDEVEHDEKIVELLEETIQGVKQGRLKALMIVGIGEEGRSFEAYANIYDNIDRFIAELQVITHDMVVTKAHHRESRITAPGGESDD